MQSKIVTVIVPVYNDRKGLDICLAALDGQTLDKGLFQVIVSDNGSRASPRDVVAKYDFAQLVEAPKPGSYHARNVACADLATPFVAFTDADCVPDEAWLANALSRFESHPDTVAIGGRIEIFTRAHPNAVELYERVFAFQQKKYITREKFSATANLFVRTEVFQAVGYFNDRLLSGGDKEWGNRLHDAGYKMDYAPDVLIRHPARISIRALVRKRRRTLGGNAHTPHLQRSVPSWESDDVDASPAPARRFVMVRRLLLRPREVGVSRWAGLRILAVLAILECVNRVEVRRLRRGGQPVR